MSGIVKRARLLYIRKERGKYRPLAAKQGSNSLLMTRIQVHAGRRDWMRAQLDPHETSMKHTKLHVVVLTFAGDKAPSVRLLARMNDRGMEVAWLDLS